MSTGHRGLPLEEQIRLDGLFDEAFAAGRARVAPISAARVRARLAWARPAQQPAGWRGVALVARLSESSLALGMTAIVFIGALGGVTGQPETVQPEQGGEFVVRVSTPVDESRFLRLLRIGRIAPVADDVDPATALPVIADDNGEPTAAVVQRQGLLR